jgi:hypothetical protein
MAALRRHKESVQQPATPRKPGRKPAAQDYSPATPIRAAFWARATSALRAIAEGADETSLQRAVEAPTDAGALARAVSDNAALGSAVDELDPLAALIARGAEQKLGLLKQAGGALPVSEVAKLLGISRQAVDKRRREGKLLAIARGADYAYPACQFKDDDVVPGLADVLAARGVQYPWAALAFLVTPDDQLGGRAPLEALQRKDAKLKDVTLRLARAAAGDGFG